jgi:uncharacterized protein YbaA (DUF1428 family)
LFLPVPADKKEAYRKAAADFSPDRQGIRRDPQVEAWGDDVPDGKVTDFKGAVQGQGRKSWFFAGSNIRTRRRAKRTRRS